MPCYLSRDAKEILGNAGKCENRSLLNSKFVLFPADNQDHKSRTESVTRFISAPTNSAAHTSRRAFYRELAAFRPSASFTAVLAGRLVVDHAGGGLENTGLAVDRHSGQPYIPGSALKGIARMAAEKNGGSPSQVAAVFGWSAGDKDLLPALPESARKTGCAGLVSFLASHPVKDNVPLTADILTCHHPKYYQDDSSMPVALDIESPIPNVFPVVEAGAAFEFVLAPVSENRAKWVATLLGLPDDFDPLEFAKRSLIAALTDYGVGAKTAAGYGWFQYDAEADRRIAAEQADQRREEENRRRMEAEEQTRMAALPPVEKHKETLCTLSDEAFAGFAKALAGKTSDEQKALLELLAGARKDAWKRWKKNKPELAEALRQIAKNHGSVLS